MTPGDVCSRGGVRLAYGADDNHDGLLAVTEDDGAVLVCSPDCGAYQCGGACGVCGVGYACGAGLCGDVNECEAPEPACGANAACSNTPGAFSCACLNGYEGDGRVCTLIPTCTGLVCDTGCVQPAEDVENCGACGIQCGTGQACVAGVCLGSGQLRFSSTWSRPGDIDVWVTTPSGASIGWQQQTADGGRQDRDDTSGTGPENIYWEVSPVSGTYSVCVATNYARPTAAAPVTVTVVIARPHAEDETLSATYTDSRAFDRGQKCTPAHPTYLGSVVVE